MQRILQSVPKLESSRIFTILHGNGKKLISTTASRLSENKSSKSKDDQSIKKPMKESKSCVLNLYRGEIQLAQVFPYPDVLTQEQTDTIRCLMEPVTKFFQESNDPSKNEEIESVEPKTLQGLWEMGLFSLQVPEDLGGLGLNNTQYARLVELVGGDLGVAITLGAHQSIGFKGILLFGTPEQKKKYLPRVSTGGEFAAFCLTEPSSGSDASSIRTRAVLSPDGKYYILNGSKIWISNGGMAEIMTVFAQTRLVNEKTGKEEDKVTAFIVERGFGGVTNGPPEKKMGIKASNTAEVYYEDVRVPVENVLGGVGNGFKVAMNILNNGRFGMAAALSGTMRIVNKKAVEHANTRVQFGKEIKNYDTIREKIARMALAHYVTESLAYMISGNMDSGSTDYHIEAAISKVFASEAAWFVTDEAIQILGGMGYMKDCGLEKIMRDLRIFRIFEGTNDILRLFIALTGIQYAGGRMKELQKAVSNPLASLPTLFAELTRRTVRVTGLNITDAVSNSVCTDLKSSAFLYTKLTVEFNRTVEELLVKYGRNIVDEQFILNRLANATIDMYTMVVVMSRATRAVQTKLPSAQHELLLAQTWCSEASSRVSDNLHATCGSEHLSNYSNMKSIANNIFEEGNFKQNNPLNF